MASCTDLHKLSTMNDNRPSLKVSLLIKDEYHRDN